MNNRELKQPLDHAKRLRAIESLNPVAFIEYAHRHDLWKNRRRV